MDTEKIINTGNAVAAIVTVKLLANYFLNYQLIYVCYHSCSNKCIAIICVRLLGYFYFSSNVAIQSIFIGKRGQ